MYGTFQSLLASCPGADPCVQVSPLRGCAYSHSAHFAPGQALGDSVYLVKPSFKEMLWLILTQATSNTVNQWGGSELIRFFCKIYLNLFIYYTISKNPLKYCSKWPISYFLALKFQHFISDVYLWLIPEYYILGGFDHCNVYSHTIINLWDWKVYFKGARGWRASSSQATPNLELLKKAQEAPSQRGGNLFLELSSPMPGGQLCPQTGSWEWADCQAYPQLSSKPLLVGGSVKVLGGDSWWTKGPHHPHNSTGHRRGQALGTHQHKAWLSVLWDSPLLSLNSCESFQPKCQHHKHHPSAIRGSSTD